MTALGYVAETGSYRLSHQRISSVQREPRAGVYTFSPYLNERAVRIMTTKVYMNS